MKSPLLNTKTHVIQFKDKIVRITFAETYQNVSVKASSLFGDVMSVSISDMCNDHTVTEDGDYIDIKMNTLPLFQFTNMTMLQKIFQTIFGVRYANLILELGNNTDAQFFKTYQDNNQHQIDNYLSKCLIGNTAYVFRTMNKYNLRTGKEEEFSLFNVDMDEVNELYMFGLMLEPMTGKHMSIRDYPYEIQSFELLKYPRDRNRVNFIELFNAVQIGKTFKGTDYSCNAVAICYPQLNVYRGLHKKTTILKLFRSTSMEQIYYDNDENVRSIYVNGKSFKRLEKNTIKLFVTHPDVEVLTVYLDGTISITLKTLKIDHVAHERIEKLIAALKLQEYESRYRTNSGYVIETYNYEIALTTDLDFTFNKNDNFYNGTLFVNKESIKRLMLKVMPILSNPVMFKLFQDTIDNTLIKENDLKKHYYPSITYYKIENSFVTSETKTILEFKKFADSEHIDFMLNFIYALSEYNKATITTKKEITSESKLVNIRDKDPTLFGHYKINGKNVPYSKLVSHNYERPIIISQEEYDELIDSKPHAVISIQNQTHSTERTYLYCEHPVYSTINFRQTDASCYPRCTKMMRVRSQFLHCLKKLDGVTYQEEVDSKRIIEFKATLSPGQRCNLPKIIQPLFPQCYFEIIELDSDTPTIYHYCKRHFDKNPVLFSMIDDDLIIYNVDNLLSLVGMLVFVPVRKNRPLNKPHQENVFYIMSKINHHSKTIPITKFPEIVNSIVNIKRESNHERFYKDHIHVHTLINVGGQIIGFIDTKRNIYCDVIPYDSVNGITFVEYLNNGNPIPGFPSADDFKNFDGVSMDGQSVIINNHPFICQKIEHTTKPKVMIDSVVEFLVRTKLIGINPIIVNSSNDKQLMDVHIIKFLEKMYSKGFTTIEALKSKSMISPKTDIHVLNHWIIDASRSTISEKDFKKYISKVDITKYVLDNFSLPIGSNETLVYA